jgi:hypothetical protein
MKSRKPRSRAEGRNLVEQELCGELNGVGFVSYEYRRDAALPDTSRCAGVSDTRWIPRTTSSICIRRRGSGKALWWQWQDEI